MNKKGEVFTLAVIIALILLFGMFIYESKLERDSVSYIGDNSTWVAYNIKSSNPNCDYNSISIDDTNVVILNNRSDLENSEFRIDDNCY